MAELVKRIRHQPIETNENHSNLEASTLRCPSFDHARGDPVNDAISIHPHHKIVIIEGLYVHADIEPDTPSNFPLDKVSHWVPQWSQIRQTMDELLWMNTPISQAMERLAYRHVQTGLAKDLPAAFERIQKNDALNADWIQQTKTRESTWKVLLGNQDNAICRGDTA
jgi:pantothenate kinase